jgi:hypothetical protein
MKKFLLTLLLVFVSSWGFAQTQKYTATSVAFKEYLYEYGVWEDWSEWERTSVPIYADWDRGVVYVESDEPITFLIYGVPDNYQVKDEDGGMSFYYYANAVEDEEKCTLRWRFYNDVIQLYLQYDDFYVVYNLVEAD